MKEPLFFIGAGRCGSTAMQNLFCKHPEIAYLSRLCDRYPTRPAWNRAALFALDVPIVSRLARHIAYPMEAWSYWESICPGFSNPCRDLLSSDVTTGAKDHIQRALQQHTTRRRSTLLVKLTGWPRAGFLTEVFPGAKFVHLFRDGRAVVNSELSVPWFTGWAGPENWRWGPLSPQQQEKWDRFGRSFVALAGIGWEILMDAHHAAKQYLPSADYFELSYETLCAQPVQSARSVAEFAGIEWTPIFEDTVRRTPLRSTNHKWRETLTAKQQDILNTCIRDTLAVWGYE